MQQSGGNDITSGFIRDELVPRVLAAINDRKAEIRVYLGTLLLVAENANRYLPSVLNQLSREMDDLRNDLKNGYEIEIGQIKRQESPPRSSNAKKAIGLTERESKMWEVIQRGANGLQYCRELHAAHLKPRRSWVKRGCPGTYPGAYPETRWRQTIQDEKSKVRRKALLLSRESR